MPLIRHEAMMAPTRRLKKLPPPPAPPAGGTTMTCGWGQAVSTLALPVMFGWAKVTSRVFISRFLSLTSLPRAESLTCVFLLPSKRTTPPAGNKF